MFKNKKEPKKENATEETFSLTALDIPVVQDGPSGEGEVRSLEPVEPSKNEKTKEKKVNVLWAKISVAIIIGFMAVLSLYKFVQYLNMPKVRFVNMLETLYTDIESILNDISKDSLYGILSQESYEASIDAKMIASNLKTEERHLEDVLNALSYVSVVRVDRPNGYFNMTLNGSKDNQDKFNLKFSLNGQKRYLNIPNMYNRSIELKHDLDLLKFSPELMKRVANIVKSELMKSLAEKKIMSKEESIGLNGKTVDCLKSSYVFSQSDFSILLNGIYNAIKADNTSYTFLAYLFGSSSNEMDVCFERLKEQLGLSYVSEYQFSVYTRKDLKEGSRLELYFVDKENGNRERTISYSREFSYKGFENRIGNDINGVTLKGSLSETFMLNVMTDEEVYNMTARPTEDGKMGAMAIVQKSKSETLKEFNWSYSIKQESNTAYSMTGTFDYKNYTDNGGADYKVTPSVIINLGTVSKEDIPSNTILLEDYEKEVSSTLYEKFKDMLKGITLVEPVAPPEVQVPIEADQGESIE